VQEVVSPEVNYLVQNAAGNQKVEKHSGGGDLQTVNDFSYLDTTIHNTLNMINNIFTVFMNYSQHIVSWCFRIANHQLDGVNALNSRNAPGLLIDDLPFKEPKLSTCFVDVTSEEFVMSLIDVCSRAIGLGL